MILHADGLLFRDVCGFKLNAYVGERLSRMYPGFGREDGQYGAVRKKDRAAEEKGTKIMRLFALRAPTRHLNMPIQSYEVTSVTCSIEVDMLAQCYEIPRKRRTYERLTGSRTKTVIMRHKKVFGVPYSYMQLGGKRAITERRQK